MTKEQPGNKKKIYKKLRHQYRLVILNVDTFEERFSLILSPLNVFTWGGIIMIILVGLLVSALAFTPLRHYLPGYADNIKTKRIAYHAASMADSLEQELRIKNQYLDNLQAIVEGRPVQPIATGTKDTSVDYNRISLKRSVEDSLLRDEIESEEQYNLLATDEGDASKGIAAFFFFTPLKGLVTASFDPGKEHYGVDVAAAKNEAVKACLEGTVIIATWTSETGHVIQVQHGNNLVSVYKHNSVLLKKSGDRVNAGEAIAIIGESGELSSGPHLHFELWYEGKPVDPSEFMTF